jgi:hypothetical protein
VLSGVGHVVRERGANLICFVGGRLRAPYGNVLLVASLLLVACTAPPEVPVAPTITQAEPTTTTRVAAGPIYKDPEADIEDRVEDLLARMTLAEKIGQMTQVEKNSIREQDITDRFIGGLLSGGGGYPSRNTPEGWADMVNGFQEYALQTRLGIPLIYGVDAIHGHGGVEGATVFPHNIGLGATRDPDLVERIGRATAQEMVATGIGLDHRFGHSRGPQWTVSCRTGRIHSTPLWEVGRCRKAMTQGRSVGAEKKSLRNWRSLTVLMINLKIRANRLT